MSELGHKQTWEFRTIMSAFGGKADVPLPLKTPPLICGFGHYLKLMNATDMGPIGYLTEHRQVPSNKIVLFGRSLGGAIAAHVGAGHDAGGLVLESAFTSLPEIASNIYWFFPAKWLTRMEYNTKAALQSISSPVLVIHSPEDGLVPYSHGKELFEAASSPKQFLELRGGHNGGFLRDRKLYLQGLDRFLTEHL